LRMRYVAQRESSRHRSEFFLWILISSLSVSYTLPWFMIPFIPTLYFASQFFFKPRHTHEKNKHLIMYEKDLSEQPPLHLLYYDYVMCVCVWTWAREPNAISLFSPSKKIFRSPCHFVWTFFSLTMETKSLTRHYPPQQKPHTTLPPSLICPAPTPPPPPPLIYLAGDFWIKRGRRKILIGAVSFFF
jgi:hypothetical protein